MGNNRTEKRKMNKPNQLIILGGGTSLSEGISKDLWNKIKNKFTLGTNYSYNFFDSTVLCYADAPFYKEESKNVKFKNLPLIIGKKHPQLKPLSNTIALETNDSKYYRDVKLGIWKSNLCGLFALSLAIYLLDEGQIYLLGYDYGNINDKVDTKNRKITHFYQGKISHRGIGKVNYFNTKGRADKDFSPYSKETKCRIYNVSVNSKITTFPKLSWTEFFEKISDSSNLDQNKLRKYIREKLKV